MDYENVLSVGEVFDYPLVGGESLYGLLPTLNEKFSLNLTEEDFTEQIAKRRKQDGLICLLAIDNTGLFIYNFVNLSNQDIENVESVIVVKEGLPEKESIMGRPVNFKEQLDFLSTLEKNVSIYYGLLNSKTLIELSKLLTLYEYGNFKIAPTTGNENSVSGFILRYYGKGKDVPSEYGTFDPDITVAFIDLIKQGYYVTHCLRTKVYHVHDNGYRSGD